MMFAWVSHVAFWLLLAYGYVIDELTPRRVATFVALWLAGRVAERYAPIGWPSALCSTVEPILAIALVFIVFRHDLRIV